MEFVEEKKRQRTKRFTDASNTKHQQSNVDNSTITGVMFAGMVLAQICADGGSDINLMPEKIFAELLQLRAQMTVKKFDKGRKFGLAAAGLYVSCDREVVLNTELQIRHGKSLPIRNLRCLVAFDAVDESLPGQPI